MPRSSRHKSQKQHKHSSKEARERSDSEEDANLKDRKGREEAAVGVSRDPASGEKRKLVSQSLDGKDLFGPGNGDLADEYVASKRRKDKADGAVTDRWNGGEDERGEDIVGDKETKGEGFRPESEKGTKLKVSVDSKSTFSRRHENLNERKEENAGLAGENEEGKKSSSKVESKRKPEKDSGRKEVCQSKDAKKERASEKERKVQDARRERSTDTVPGRGVVGSEVGRKQGSQSRSFEEERPKREVENTEWQIQDEVRNPELEKELEKRIRQRRDSSPDKDKYQDNKDKRLSSRDDHANNGRYKDEKHKDGRYRDKHREDQDRDVRHRDDKHRDERSSRDHTNDRSDTKHLRDENKAVESRHKKSKPRDSDHDGSPRPDDQGIRYKDSRGKKRSSDGNEDHSEVKFRSTKEHRPDVDKKLYSSSKVESRADRGRSQARHIEVDSNVSNSRRKSSPSSSAHVAKDHIRHSSKQADSKYRDLVSEERVRLNVVTTTREVSGVIGVQERTSESRSLEKRSQKDDNHLSDLSVERSPRSDAQASPMQLMEKSPSSTSFDRRYSNRTSARRSLDVEETGRRSTSSKDARDYFTNEERGSREFPLEKPAVDEFAQADGDTVSVSSSFSRTFPSSSSSLLPPPPPFRAGVDSPSVFGSSEEDSRSKSTNRFKRSGDPSVGRGQGNAWKGVTNWSSPVTNGYIPFQHGPPPGGFHAVMQQFPPPLFSVRPSMEINHAGLPYHIPDADRFSGHGRPFGWRNPTDESYPPHFHGWDGSNGVFGDDPHMYGRPDWDQNRHLMSGSADMWKGQNGGMNMELSTPSQKEDYQLPASAEEICAGQSGQQSRNEWNLSASRAEGIEIKRSSGAPSPKDTSEAPPITIHEMIPEPRKISIDDDPHFFHAYLSKIDISVDLTHPELYDRCMGLLDIKGKMTDDEDVTKHVHPELKGSVAGANISNTTMSASLFPAVSESVFQRAMALYKKQREEMSAKLLVSTFPESEPLKVPTSDCEKLEQVPTSNQEEVEDSVPTSKQEEAEEPVPTSKQEEGEEPVATSDVGKTELLVPIPSEENSEEKVEVTVSSPDEQKIEEPVLTCCEEKSETIPTSNQNKVELVACSNQEKSEEEVGDHFLNQENASQVTSNLTSINDDINSSSNSKGNPIANSAGDHQVFGDIMCGPLGRSDGIEACEALMSESIECGLVNLSRIHHSPESTH